MEYNEFEKKLKDKETIIVLDTNVILDLARYSLPTSENIKEIFAQCSDLIWIPNQVITEYNNNKKDVFDDLKKRYPNFEKSLKETIKKTKNNLMEKFRILERYNYRGIEECKNDTFTKSDEAIDAIESYKETIAAEYIATSWYPDTIKQDIEKFVCDLKGTIETTKNNLMKQFKIPERYNYRGIEECKNDTFTKLDEAINAIESYKETIVAEYIAISWYPDTIKQDIEELVCDLKGTIETTKNNLMKKFKIPERYNYRGIEECKNDIFTKLDEAINAIESYKETIAAEYIATSWYPDTIKQDIEEFVCDLKGKNQVGCKISEEEELEIINEGESRYRNKMPPGFKDDKKEGVGKFGDLFLWKEILKLPSMKEVKNIIFITNDEKNDWWYKDKKGNPLNLRSELYKEFTEFNPGVSIDFMTMKIFQSYASKLYNLYEPYVYIDFNKDDDSFINRINEKIEADIKDALYTSPEDYLGVDIAIDYIEDCAFIKIKDTYVVIESDDEVAGIGINYELVYQVELHCDSEDYLEDDEYVFVGTVVVSINRLIEKSEAKNNPQYFNEDDEYYVFEIIENDIEQLD